MELVIFSNSYIEIFEKEIQKLPLSISNCASEGAADYASVLRNIPD